MLLVSVLLAVVFLLGLHILMGAVMGLAKGTPMRGGSGWLLVGVGLCMASGVEFLPTSRLTTTIRTVGILVAAVGMVALKRDLRSGQS